VIPAVGLVGFGLAGRVFHAPLILASGMEIVGVVSRQRDAVSAALPAAGLLPDLGALLSLPRLDLVVIATPNDLHECRPWRRWPLAGTWLSTSRWPLQARARSG